MDKNELVVLGLSWAKEALLREAGFDTLEKIRAASDEELDGVLGIGAGTVWCIRRALRHLDKVRNLGVGSRE